MTRYTVPMEDPLSRFEGGTVQFLPTVSAISFGLDVVQKSIAATLEQIGAKTVLLLTPHSIRSGHIVGIIKDALKGITVDQISLSAEHVPVEVLADGLSQVVGKEPDCVIAVGGSSTIDLAKGMRIFHSLGIREIDQILEFMRSPTELDEAPVPQISIPTTLSGSEYTRSFSVVDFNSQEKLSFTEMLCSSGIILYDPVATRETPKRLWMSSGIMALNHAVEVLVASPPNVISDSMKLTSAAYLLRHLPESAGNPDLPEVNHARELCQTACWMADHSPMRIRTNSVRSTILYSHSLAYQVAARYRVPYGLIACTTLPSCLRNYEEEDEIFKTRIAQISSALSNHAANFTDTAVGDESKDLINTIENLIIQSGLPSRLRDVGIPRDGLSAMAEDFGIQNSGGSEDYEQKLTQNASKILEDAW